MRRNYRKIICILVILFVTLTDFEFSGIFESPQFFVFSENFGESVTLHIRNSGILSQNRNAKLIRPPEELEEQFLFRVKSQSAFLAPKTAFSYALALLQGILYLVYMKTHLLWSGGLVMQYIHNLDGKKRS